MSDIGRETPQERPIFPLTKEAVSRSLGEIAESPDKIFQEEGAIIQTQNPELNKTLNIRIKTAPEFIKEQYAEGALYTYRILRTQAELNGTQLPRVSRDLVIAYLSEAMDRVKGKGLHTLDLAKQQGEQILTGDPEFGTGIKKMLFYRPGREHFYGGMIDTYRLLKNASESNDLSRKFGL